MFNDNAADRSEQRRQGGDHDAFEKEYPRDVAPPGAQRPQYTDVFLTRGYQEGQIT